MANAQNPLETFVRDALAQGQSADDIRAALVETGWPADQIDAALGAWAGTRWGVPVPRPKRQVSARDAFFYLTLFFSLALSVWALSFIWFALVDVWIADPLARTHGDDLRTPISILLVAFPAYFSLSLLVGREVKRDPERRRSPVRRWITYTILFCTAVVMLIDLIVLINRFLSGELTESFIVKCLVVALVHGVVFTGYLIMQGRDDAADKAPRADGPSWPRLLLWLGAGFAILSLVLALFVAPSPGQARAERTDMKQIETLNLTEMALNCAWEETGVLPASLNDLNSAIGRCPPIQFDTAGIRYTPGNNGEYELCARFEAEGVAPRPVAGKNQSFAIHKAGEHCFQREVYSDPPTKPVPLP